MNRKRDDKLAVPLSLTVSLIAILFLYSYGVQNEQQKLAGNAAFPLEIHQRWLEIQNDASSDTISKIKSTIDAYFRVIFESWLRGILLDFGFLFDQSDTDAFEDYTYERGLFHLYLTGQMYWSGPLIHYDYKPVYDHIKLSGMSSSVLMRPKTTIVSGDTPDRVGTALWSGHNFSLNLKGNQWLIQDITTDDEFRSSYPRNTNFDKLAATFADRMRTYEIEDKKEDEERRRKDPRYKKNIESRIKSQREDFAKQRQEEQDRIIRYHDIAGEYIFEELGMVLFFVQDRYLVAKEESQTEGVILQQVEHNPLEFQFRPRIGEVSELKFLRDETGKVTKCYLRKNGKEYQGQRVTNK